MLKTHAQVKEYEAGIGNDVECVFDGQLESLKSTATKLGAISPAGLDAESVAYLSRNEIASRMRSSQPLQICLLVGGMVRCNYPARAAPAVEVEQRVQKQILAGSVAYKSKSNNQAIDEKDDVSTSTIINRPDSPRSSALDVEFESPSINPFLTPKLFWLDQYGSLQNMPYAAHGYGSNFAYSIIDQRYRNDMSRKEAVDLIRECFEQLRQRYVINNPCPPRIKCIDISGVADIREDIVKNL